MGYMLDEYKFYKNKIEYTILIDGEMVTKPLKDFKIENIEFLLSSLKMTPSIFIDDIFILEDELFNRRIKKLNYGYKQNIFRKILQR